MTATVLQSKRWTSSTKRCLGVGVQLPEVERVVRWPEIKEMATRAEAVGFDSVWLGDHLLYRRPSGETVGPWEAWTTLAGIAAATDRIILGPLVASTSFHAPAMLAKMASTVDEMSAGRLVVGVGAGWNETEYRGFGFPFDRRISRFEEAFTIIRQLLAGETVDFDGKWYQVEQSALRPERAQPGPPPLMVGSSGPRMLGITVPHVQAWNAWFTSFDNRVDGLGPLFEKIERACEPTGRDPGEIRRTVALMIQAPGGAGRSTGDPSKPTIAPIAGEPGQIAETLHAFADAGVHHVQLVLDPITLGSIEWCAEILEQLDAG